MWVISFVGLCTLLKNHIFERRAALYKYWLLFLGYMQATVEWTDFRAFVVDKTMNRHKVDIFQAIHLNAFINWRNIYWMHFPISSSPHRDFLQHRLTNFLNCSPVFGLVSFTLIDFKPLRMESAGLIFLCFLCRLGIRISSNKDFFILQNAFHRRHHVMLWEGF